jgi:predicted transcriptional regulator
MTLTVPPDIEEQITALAKASGRNPKALAAEALRAYVAREERIIAGIRKGIEAAERGEGIPHDQFMAELDAIISKAEDRLKAEARQ